MDPRSELARVLASPRPSLFDAAWCVAQIAGRAPDRGDVDAELDLTAARVQRADLDGLVAALRDGGFAGPRSRYEDPRNSMIDLVVTRKVGIPISLAIVAIEVGLRVGVELQAVGMPGHFLVGSAAQPDRFGDPFHGRVIDRDECAAIVRRLAGGARSLHAGDLDPTSPGAVVARMLNNLIAGPWGRDLKRLGDLCDLQMVVPDLASAERFALAGRLELLGRFDDAAAQLDEVAAHVAGSARRRLDARVISHRARYN